MDNLRIFSAWSGLQPSVHKSTSYLCNCDHDFFTWFDETFSIPRGSLPVHFLAIPPISSQLCINDCVPLIDKITSKLSSWANMLLFFAGRALLIKFIIHAIQGYSSNHFLLPSAVHQNIQSLLTRFLWKGNITHKGGAKVAWDTVCLPKNGGGLGLKNMVHWNRAQLILHLPKVCTKSNSLWATWVNHSVLKLRHFWVIDIPSDCSWIWKKILRLRSLAIQFIRYHIFDGSSISLWFELWWNQCCLAKSQLLPSLISVLFLAILRWVISFAMGPRTCLQSILELTM